LSRIDSSQVGLDVEENAHSLNQTFNRRDIENTITQTIHSIAYVLSEIEVLRGKYDLKPAPGAKGDSENSKHLRSWKSFGSLFIASPNPTALQQRMQENQRQKSFLAIAKWASVDARKLEEKIRALKSLIDGLESVSKAAGVPTRPSTAPLGSIMVSDDSPPPYTTSLRPRPRRSATEGAVPSQPMTSRQTLSSAASSASTLRTHFATMKRYLAEYPDKPNLLRKSRDKLVRLSEAQIEELIIDIYDELIRRQTLRGIPDHLLETPTFDAKRNQARKRFGALPEPRLQDLVSDLVSEMEKRYPVLLEHLNQTNTSAQNLAVIPESRSRSRSQSAAARIPQKSTDSPNYSTAPASLSRQHSAQNSTDIKPAQSLLRQHSAQKPSDLKRTPPTTPSSPSGSETMEIFKSFRVTLNDPTSKILPDALKKYGIDAPWEQYSLYLVAGEKERCLGLDEKPLIVFKELSEAGGKPLFMLRKCEK
jgi:protein STE50